MREYTNLLADAMVEGTIDPYQVALMALGWMTDDDVEGMVRANDLVDFLVGDRDNDEDDN